MTDYIMAYDFGNRLIKAANDQYEIDFTHASAKLNSAQLKNLQERGDDSDVWIINQTPYMIGERASRYSTQFSEGANRYNHDYYERFLGKSLWHLYPESRRDIVLFAGHAPRDIEYREDIKKASIGNIVVEHQNETRRYKIAATHCWDEPIGGVMMQLLTHDGTRFNNAQYERGDMLVIDIGGLTIDYIIVSNAKPDYASARSFTEANIIDAVDQFTGLLKQRYPQETRSRNNLPKERIYDAVHTGLYDAGGHGMLDCQHESDTVCEDIVDSIQSFYDYYGGEQLHFVLLTGGGAGLLEQRIRNRMMINGKQRKGVHMAWERKSIHMANVLGAHKLALFYHANGKM